jgi:hypothetical protein
MGFGDSSPTISEAVSLSDDKILVQPAIYMRGGDDPEMIGRFDTIVATLRRQDLSIKQRLLALLEIFEALREV